MLRLRTFTTLAAACGMAASAHAQIDWVTFTENAGMRAFEPGEINLPGQTGDETDLIWGDLDRNGWDDLVVVRKQPFTSAGKRTNILLMNELGTLTDRTSLFATCSDVPGDNGFATPTNDRDVQLVDVDQDGWLDVVTAVTLSSGDPKAISHPRIYMNLGEDGNGDWLGLCYEEARIPQVFLLNGSGQPTSATFPKYCSVGVGDVTGDGFPELYFGDYDSGPGGGGDVNNRLLVNDGNGYFTDSLETRMDSTHLLSAFGAASVIADINGDGVNDVLKQTALSPPQHIAVSYNDPANEGNFNIYQVVMDSAPYHVNSGDLNNDGKLDIIVSSDGNDRYRLNGGNDPLGRVLWGTNYTFSFSPAGGFGDDGFGSNNLIADLDMDGWNEALICDVDVDIASYGGRLHIYHNLGQPGDEGGFVDMHEEAENNGWVAATGLTTDDLISSHDVGVFDIDNDGANDLVISRNRGTYTWESSIDVTTCQEDRGFGGPGGESLSICGKPLGTGGSAQLVLSGAEPFAAAILLIGGSDAQTFNPVTGVSTITPLLFKIQFANGAGVRQFNVTGGSGENGIVDAYIQYLVSNGSAGSAEGWSASNVVRVELEE